MYINVPNSDILGKLLDLLDGKYGIKVKRFFIGFKEDSGSKGVMVINDRNLNYAAKRIADCIDEEGVVELFRNNTAYWNRVK